MTDFSAFGLAAPDILIPKNIDTKTWCVVACDQYTQDPAYWEKAKKIAEGRPSTLNLIFPEAYLNQDGKAERIQNIKGAMSSYLSKELFCEFKNCMVYVERTSAYGRVRKGLVAALDLERYDWKPFSSALTRATEATIMERIPPRMEIRRGAPLELPHIMLLANDPGRALVEALGQKITARGDATVYDGPLMMESGSIRGWKIQDGGDLEGIKNALQALLDAGTKDKSAFLFAVGDGNHSLATAKAVWEEEKKRLADSGKSAQEIQQSPVRFALVEIVNIYDEGLNFEPIHRVIFEADPAALADFLAKKLGATISSPQSKEALEQKVKQSASSFGLFFSENGIEKCLLLEAQIQGLAASRFQPALDEFLQAEPKAKIDYIHGAEEIFRLGKKDGAIGILLPPIAKDSFFETIERLGPLPRKSFSMGEASEKRFYLEARRLF